MKPVRLGGEGQAAGGKRGSPRVKMGSHVWFHWRHPQETHAFHSLTIQGGGAWNGTPVAERAVFPGASKFFEQPREDWEGLLHRTSGQRIQHLILTGLGGLCGRPGNIQPGGCMFAHVRHIQGGGGGSTTPTAQSNSRGRGLCSPAGLCRRSRCNCAVAWSGGG